MSVRVDKEGLYRVLKKMDKAFLNVEKVFEEYLKFAPYYKEIREEVDKDVKLRKLVDKINSTVYRIQAKYFVFLMVSGIARIEAEPGIVGELRGSSEREK